jgi:hypothetical protein
LNSRSAWWGTPAGPPSIAGAPIMKWIKFSDAVMTANCWPKWRFYGQVGAEIARHGRRPARHPQPRRRGTAAHRRARAAYASSTRPPDLALRTHAYPIELTQSQMRRQPSPPPDRPLELWMVGRITEREYGMRLDSSSL